MQHLIHYSSPDYDIGIGEAKVLSVIYCDQELAEKQIKGEDLKTLPFGKLITVCKPFSSLILLIT